MIMNGEYGRICKWVAMGYFKVLFYSVICLETKKNQPTPHLRERERGINLTRIWTKYLPPHYCYINLIILKLNFIVMYNNEI
jgi:hypothetical protein